MPSRQRKPMNDQLYILIYSIESIKVCSKTKLHEILKNEENNFKI